MPAILRLARLATASLDEEAHRTVAVLREGWPALRNEQQCQERPGRAPH